jgi:hypothetical protein
LIEEYHNSKQTQFSQMKNAGHRISESLETSLRNYGRLREQLQQQQQVKTNNK